MDGTNLNELLFCVGLVWEAVESLAIWLVYNLLNAPADILLGLWKAISGWTLEHSKLLVLGDLNAHTDAVASSQAKNLVSSMVALELSLFVSGPTHQAGYTLDLIFATGLEVGLITADAVPALKYLTPSLFRHCGYPGLQCQMKPH